MISTTPASSDNPRWMTWEDIEKHERRFPDDAGLGAKMINAGVWVLTDDPRLSGQLVSVRGRW